MSIQTVRVELLGASFAIQTDESREYIESVMAYLRDKVAAVKESTRVDDPLKTAILAGIYLVDELYRERVDGAVRAGLDAGGAAGGDIPDDGLSAVAERLIARIDESLAVPMEAAGPAAGAIPKPDGTNGDRP